MKNRYIAIVIVLGLLSQQVMAGVMGASMLSHMTSPSSRLSDSESDASTHEGHGMVAHHGDMTASIDSDKNADSHASTMDCCDIDCGCCSACSHPLIQSFSPDLSLLMASQPNQRYSSEPLVQILASLFRPPIFA